MKAVKLIALVLIAVAIGANASARSFRPSRLLCDLSTDPTLCNQATGADTGCAQYCETTPDCDGFYNLTHACVVHGDTGGYDCACRGKPSP